MPWRRLGRLPDRRARNAQVLRWAHSFPGCGDLHCLLRDREHGVRPNGRLRPAASAWVRHCDQGPSRRVMREILSRAALTSAPLHRTLRRGRDNPPAARGSKEPRTTKMAGIPAAFVSSPRAAGLARMGAIGAFDPALTIVDTDPDKTRQTGAISRVLLRCCKFRI